MSCKDVIYEEYGDTVPCRLDKTAPKCPFIAVIPTIVVDNTVGIKGLANCFVHVSNINTTFYIDDKHRTIITWAGPVEEDDYDYENNPLGLRSQVCYDFANNRAIYYNRVGNYKLITLSSGE